MDPLTFDIVIDPASAMKVNLCYSCTDGINSLSSSFQLLIVPMCEHFYDSSFHPAWLIDRSDPYLINPSDHTRLELYKLFALSGGQCASNTCEIYEPDCTTLVPSPFTYF